ncbi:MAG: CoA transferase [Chloroflexi bacterium]|nr:CoA transferase [Chloroflexota bacterium]MCI0798968.1 CoA transferase [Chloroflexota bacterium]MCI0824026.1 CoA transferase [Chloroflexota bacterium]MCI0858623.1 CoA transferase [Chloroflexota bacterium]MCI0895513.1 CoA transferase [Chloroflexota bacterium]
MHEAEHNSTIGQALDGVRVVEVAQVWAAPGAGMYLADQGADVVKIEPLWGDDARRVFTQPPMAGGESRSFLPLNRNKRGMAVDISCPEGRDIVYQLVDQADVFIHNFRPGVDQKLGYDYDLLRGRNPGLIYAAVSAFGTRGPYAHRRGYDLLFQALSGILGKRRTADGTPIASGVWVADASMPIAIAYGVALALLVRHRTGRGQRVDASLLQMALAMQSVDMVRVEQEAAQEDGLDFSAQALYSPYKCQDGKFLIMVVLNDSQFAGLCRALDLEHLIGDPEYSDNLKRARHSQDLRELIEGILSTQPRDRWLEVLEHYDVPAAPVLERDEVFNHPQIVANDMLATQHHPQAGEVEMFNIPIHLSETPGRLRTPAPLLGQHTQEILAELGYDSARIARLRDSKVIG